jgi:diacylglycerol O-acyltransferase
MTPLDPRHPLWQFHLVEHYEGGSALIARIHHCIGDGIALISVMMSITDGGNRPAQARARSRSTATTRRNDWLADAVLKPLTDFTVKAIGMYGGGVASRRHAGQPAAAAAGSHGHGAHRLQVVNDVAALALMPDDSPTLLKGKPKGTKVVAWSEPHAAGRGQGHRQGAWAARSTTCCWPARPGPSASYLRARGKTRPARRSAPWCR